MKFSNDSADLFIPDDAPIDEALKRTTHLAVAAHQDDLEILAYHGILECFGSSSRWFGGVVVTDGSGSARSGVYSNFSDADMRAVRKLEQQKAAVIGEYSFAAQLAHPSARVKANSAREPVEDIRSIFDACRPEVVYLHNPADKHATHVAVLQRCLSALRELNPIYRPKKIYGCEVWRDLDWMPDADKVVLPVDRHENLGEALVAVFDSQINGGKRYDLATTGRRRANATFHESHSVDACRLATFAMDLTPLLEKPELDLLDYTRAYIAGFMEEVEENIRKFQA